MFAVPAILLVVAGGLWFGGVFGSPVPPSNVPASPPADPFPLPPISDSPFRNTRSGVKYVGSAACETCHPERAASFRRTGMGVSMAVVDLIREPPDATFDHAKSTSRFQVVRKGGQMWHRESLTKGGAGETLLSEYPVKYVVGSGRHTRTYLAEAEGFLVESPITWYASRQSWDMSPGYDRPDHQGFERGIVENCLYCHAGRSEAVEKASYRMHVEEAAIGCERCHGPGELHAERYAAGKPKVTLGPGGIDDTIVNPARLPRDRAEAVCQQCHLQAATMIPVRGRKIADFRPGLLLDDFRTDYCLDTQNTEMSVVGHVEQMHFSRCYKESKTLTCTTCHDPHAFPRKEEKTAYYRAICLGCHKPQECKVSPEQLRAESADNDCTRCHMPTSSTDIPHVSFTHHRIGIHKPAIAANTAPDSRPGVLVPWRDVVSFAEIDKKRSLGLAYTQLALAESDPMKTAAYKRTAFDLLSSVSAAGVRDAAVEARLSRLLFEANRPDARAVADMALSHQEITGFDRCAALFVAGAERLRENRPADALISFRELVTLRRHPDDWILTAECERKLGNQAAANSAIETAARIRPQMKVMR